MNLVDGLLGLVAEFEAGGVRYALCSGLAVAAHGHPRFTKDIDVLVPEQELARVRAAARRRGFILGRLTFGAGSERERGLFRISKAEGANVGGSGVTNFAGLRCVGGSVRRIGQHTWKGGGVASWVPNLIDPLHIGAGGTDHFQSLYRDVTSPCAPANFTNLVSVTFTP